MLKMKKKMKNLQSSRFVVHVVQAPSLSTLVYIVYLYCYLFVTAPRPTTCFSFGVTSTPISTSIPISSTPSPKNTDTFFCRHHDANSSTCRGRGRNRSTVTYKSSSFGATSSTALAATPPHRIDISNTNTSYKDTRRRNGSFQQQQQQHEQQEQQQQQQESCIATKRRPPLLYEDGGVKARKASRTRRRPTRGTRSTSYYTNEHSNGSNEGGNEHKRRTREQGNYATVLHNLSQQKTHESAMIAYNILTKLEKNIEEEQEQKRQQQQQGEEHQKIVSSTSRWSSSSLSATSATSTTYTKSLNVVHYASVINAFANVGDAPFAAKILHDMMERYKRQNTDDNSNKDEQKDVPITIPVIVPNAHCFSGVIKAYIIQYQKVTGSQQQRGGQRQYQQHNQYSGMGSFRNSQNHRSRSHSHPSRSGNYQEEYQNENFSLSEKCEEVLQQMDDFYQFIKSSSSSSSSINDSGIHNVNVILDDDVPKPNTFCYNMLLKAYMEEAASLVVQQKMNKRRNEEDDNIHKIKSLINKATNLLTEMESSSAMSIVKQIGGGKRAKEQTKSTAATTTTTTNDKRIHNGSQAYEQNTASPDSYSYCTVISLMAKYCAAKNANANTKKRHSSNNNGNQNDDDSINVAELAESYLEKVVPLYDTSSYNSVMLAWSNIGNRYGAERATLLLEKLERESASVASASVPTHTRGKVRGGSIGPNNVSYNTCIFAWAKSYSYGDEATYAATRAEEVLEKMEKRSERITTKLATASSPSFSYCRQPNVISYSSIIDCWSRSGSLNGAMKAQRLLDKMEHLYLSGENKLLKPNIITYTSVLTAYARTNTVEGAMCAQNLLGRVKDLYAESKDKDIKPNIVSYFAVIDGWARSNSTEAGIKAESILTELESSYHEEGDRTMRPDVRVYARVIAAHVKSNNLESFTSAEKIVHRMERCSKTCNNNSALAKPNVVIYNTLINEYARRRQSRNALRILNQMDTYNSAQVEKDKVRADEHTLNGLLYALSTSNEKGKSRKALKILERLENSHIDEAWDVKPSTRSYNFVINACANSFQGDDKEKFEAIEIAMSVYSKLVTSSYAEVDRFTFISLLKACGKLLPAESERRQNYVMGIFHSCCHEGLVDDDILANFLLALPSHKLPESILFCVSDSGKSEVTTASMLPDEWTFRAKKIAHT